MSHWIQEDTPEVKKHIELFRLLDFFKLPPLGRVHHYDDESAQTLLQPSKELLFKLYSDWSEIILQCCKTILSNSLASSVIYIFISDLLSGAFITMQIISLHTLKLMERDILTGIKGLKSEAEYVYKNMTGDVLYNAYYPRSTSSRAHLKWGT